MSVTPKATPVVQPPHVIGSRESTASKQLRIPIVVVAAGREWEHECGELIIGRDTGAHVVLQDPLASRFHARLLVGPDGGVSVEDLHSANGVFVNGTKLSRPSMPLEEGDRLLIGTTEVSVFGLRASRTVQLGAQERKPTERPARQQPEPRVTLRSPESAPAKVTVPKTTVVSTGRSDAINLVGQFAEQLMDSGHPLEAVRVLTDHLQNLLKGASAGLSVPTRILDGATHYALRLHGWTQRGTCLDYVLELHMACQQVPSDVSLRELESVLSSPVKADPGLLCYFIQTIENRTEAPTPDETQRLRRIERLCQ